MNQKREAAEKAQKKVHMFPIPNDREQFGIPKMARKPLLSKEIESQQQNLMSEMKSRLGLAPLKDSEEFQSSSKTTRREMDLD